MHPYAPRLCGDITLYVNFFCLSPLFDFFVRTQRTSIFNKLVIKNNSQHLFWSFILSLHPQSKSLQKKSGKFTSLTNFVKVCFVAGSWQPSESPGNGHALQWWCVFTKNKKQQKYNTDTKLSPLDCELWPVQYIFHLANIKKDLKFLTLDVFLF